MRVCYTSLLHQRHLEGSENSSESKPSADSDCYINLLHQPSKRRPSPSSRSPQHRRANPPCLIVRGRVFHVRMKVPRKAQATVGRTQVWRSLGTGNRSEAIRKSKLVIADLERSFWAAAGTPAAEARSAEVVMPEPVTVEAAPISTMTFSDLFRHFQADPSKVRAPKTQMIYDGLLWITSSVWGENRLLTSIDRSACRELLEVLRWLGRPKCLLWARARPRPALMRAVMIERSNSAKTPGIWKSMRPEGVLVSISCGDAPAVTPVSDSSRSAPSWTPF